MGLFATARHIKRLSALEDTVAELKRIVSGLDAEWSDTNERLLRNLAKLGKRAQKLEEMESGVNGERPVQHEAVHPEAGLTVGQAQAQREILARRRALGSG